MKKPWPLNESVIKKMLPGTKQAASCNLTLGNDWTISGENQTCTNTATARIRLPKGETLQDCRQIKLSLNYKQ